MNLSLTENAFEGYVICLKDVRIFLKITGESGERLALILASKFSY
jgi:hypothetical protein